MELADKPALPDDVDALKRTVLELQDEVKQQRELADGRKRIIDKLESLLAQIKQRHWGVSSEKHPGQSELSFFNEAELLASEVSAADDAEAPNTADADEKAAPRKPRRSRKLPDHLERVRVVYDLNDAERQCACGQALTPIGEEITEQLGIIPARYYVIQIVRAKYACSCKHCMKTAPMPQQLIPGSQVSPVLLAHVMVSKFEDALPLYRQEKMAYREGLEIPRGKLARWLIIASVVLRPLFNLLQDAFFAYDIAMSDDTGIQVLKENGRSPHAKSALWIRRGGSPETPVVLVDYHVSKGAAVASNLLEHFNGYLVADAAASFNAIIAKNDLKVVYCNDHARRKFAEVIKTLPKKQATQGWVAGKAIAYYKRLYRLEKEIRDESPTDKLWRRRSEAIPIWDQFMAWAKQVFVEGVRHGQTRAALKYLIDHEEGLRRYCEDGRLPISNILSEHVAKTIALARKNFLFADTPAGAESSALIFSLLQSAKANGHNPHHYMSVVLETMPQAGTVEDIEELLPWRLTPEEAQRRYDCLPAPEKTPIPPPALKSKKSVVAA